MGECQKIMLDKLVTIKSPYKRGKDMRLRMRAKRNTIVRELDPESIEGLSEAQLQNYKHLGCSPYLMSNGSIRWLTVGQSAFRHKTKRLRLFRGSRKTKSHPRRRSNRRKLLRSNISSFLMNNLSFITIVILVILIVYII